MIRSSPDLKKRLVLVTGASRGIGAATARKFAQQGHPVILTAYGKPALDSVAAEIKANGGTAHVIPADLSGSKKAKEFIQNVLRRHPDLGAAVLNAGVAVEGAFTDRDPESFLDEFQVNYFAPIAIAHELALHWMRNKNQGSIIAVSSVTSTVPFPGHANYGASKAALNQMLRNMRFEIASANNIHVGIVMPGYTETAMTANLESVLPGSAPEFIAETVWDSFNQEILESIAGLDNKLVAGMFRFFPALSDKLLQLSASVLVPRKKK